MKLLTFSVEGKARPGALKATTLSTCPSVPSSSAIASASHTMRSTPRAARNTRSMSSRVIDGLRFGLSRQRSVVTSVPAPSTAIDPPSSTIGTSCTGSPRCSAMRPPTAASASQGDHFSPHALNPKCNAWRSPPAIATDNRKRLEAEGIAVTEISELPYARVGDSRLLPVPYVNLYVLNGAVLVPTAGAPSDDDALAIIHTEFPDRDVMAVPGAVLAHGGGGVHCITMQVPA